MPEGHFEQPLDAESVLSLQKGIEEFNSGRFFECHDTLEEVWQGVHGFPKDFFQGLIQISVGFYHIRNGNLRGGESQLTKGLKNLSGYGNRYLGVELVHLRQDVEKWLAQIRDATIGHIPTPELPKLRYIPPAPGH